MGRDGVSACRRVGVSACRRVGPKGLGSLAQALAWVVLFLGASPVRAPENAGAIHIDHTQIQMTISSAPSGLIAFIATPPRLKPGSQLRRSIDLPYRFASISIRV
jgi:hypothetical protein